MGDWMSFNNLSYYFGIIYSLNIKDLFEILCDISFYQIKCFPHKLICLAETLLDEL